MTDAVNQVTALNQDAHMPGAPTPACRQLGTQTEPVPTERLRIAKKAYTTRFVASGVSSDERGYHLLTGSDARPFPGAVLLARVLEVGQHTGLQGPEGRRQTLFLDDEIIVAYGDRYAPDQFEAFIPDRLTVTNLVAAGGLAAQVAEQHAKMADATVIEPLGLLADEAGTPLSLADFAPLTVASRQPRETGGPHVAVVFGSSMNSGKTTTLAYLVHGLMNAGLVVHAGKATGTGAWGDPGLFSDAGAAKVVDFTDFGFPSTYRVPFDSLRDLVSSVRVALSEGDPDVVVIEIADGIYQGETGRIVADPLFRDAVDSVVFAAGEALGAVAGVGRLRDLGLPVKAVSGLLTASPLATREASAVLEVPVISTFDLGQAATARHIIGMREPALLPA